MSQIHSEVNSQHKAYTQRILHIGHGEDTSDATDIVLDVSMDPEFILQDFCKERIGWLSSDE